MGNDKTSKEREYLNDFHKEWNERCEEANERVKSKRYTHEYAKAQAQRMNDLVDNSEKDKQTDKE